MRWLAVLVLFMVACGGNSSEETLHFDGYDLTYRQTQIETRASLSGSTYAATACKQFADMKPSEVLDYLDRVRAGTPTPVPTPPKSATLKPGQKADRQS